MPGLLAAWVSSHNLLPMPLHAGPTSRRSQIDPHQGRPGPAGVPACNAMYTDNEERVRRLSQARPLHRQDRTSLYPARMQQPHACSRLPNPHSRIRRDIASRAPASTRSTFHKGTSGHPPPGTYSGCTLRVGYAAGLGTHQSSISTLPFSCPFLPPIPYHRIF